MFVSSFIVYYNNVNWVIYFCLNIIVENSWSFSYDFIVKDVIIPLFFSNVSTDLHMVFCPFFLLIVLLNSYLVSLLSG